MKKTSAALFELIHSLSMAEKKYFRMSSSLKGGDKSYLKLYDAIEKQRSYNEHAIRSACRGEKFLQYLAVANSRLYNNILRSLENYHRGADINLHNQLRKAEILLGKGLTSHALKLLKTSKAIAYRHERWELLMEILVMERTPYTAVELLNMPHLNQEIKAVLEKLNNIDDYRTLHHNLHARVQKSGHVRTKKEEVFIAKLMRHPLLRNSEQALCAEAKAYYYEIWHQSYLFNQDSIKGYETAKEQCAFIETHFHRLRDPEKKHLFALNMSVIFMGYILASNRSIYGEVQKVLQKIRAYPIISPSIKAKFWTSSYVNELNAYIMANDFERVFPVLKTIKGNEDIVDYAPAITRITLFYNIAYLLFGAGSYKEALHWLRKILDNPSNELRKDTQAFARILHLLIHYELHKDEELLDSLKRSAKNFLSTRQRIFKLENALMHCLNQIMGKPISKKERSAALQEFKISLLKLMKNPMEKAVMDEFDFLSWVESKIQNKTFSEVVKEKAQLSIIN
ncbi:MAG: hypothetical protein HY840_03140 [Bacteroidetes bacterium]|nr:hypothetical protein [Bacteroidota bacterium]